MKNPKFLLIALVVAALFLSACGGANNDNSTLGTPGVNETLPADTLETPADDVVVDATPTLAVTDVVETPTVAAGVDDNLTATPAADLTGTPEANVPVTGDEAQCAPNRLSHLLDYEVVANGEVVGDVDAVVIQRDASIAMGLGAQGTDEGAAVATSTPDAAGDVDAGVAPVDPTTLAAPSIAYLIIDMDDAGNIGDKDVLVPFSAFSPPGVAGGDAEDSAEQAANAVVDCGLSLGVDLAALEGAPNLDDNAWSNGDLDFNQEGWDEPFSTYWTGEGLTINDVDPNTGAQYGSVIVIDQGFDDIDVENLDGDDLGEIEDFIINETGQFTHGILAAGGFLGLGERLIPVPMNRMAWINEDDDPDDLGEIIINVAEDTFENAPVIEDLDGTVFDDETWSTDIDTFWESVTPGVQQ